MNKACNNRLEIYSAAGITADLAASTPVSIPADVAEWYVKLTLTETSAGGITPTLYGNESTATTNPITIEAFGAISATGVTRQIYSSADFSLLPSYLFLGLASVTGTWTVLLELYYSKIDAG